MDNVKKISFQCLYGPKTVFTPASMFDVVEMRKHPDYAEIDTNGKVLKRAPTDEELINRPRLNMGPVTTPKKGK